MKAVKPWLLLSVLAALVLSACATPLKSLKRGASLPEGQACVAGSFKESRWFFQFKPSIKMVLKNTETKKFYHISYRFDDQMQLFSLPPGSYIVQSIFQTRTTTTTKPGSGSGGQGYSAPITTTKSSSQAIKVPAELLKPFTVGPNEIKYIGANTVKGTWYVFFSLFKAAVLDEGKGVYLSKLKGRYDIGYKYIIDDVFSE